MTVHTSLKVERTGAARRRLGIPRPKSWSHQNELLAMRGKEVCIRFSGESARDVIVRLLEADAFTVKIQTSNGPAIVYKHDILWIQPLNDRS